CSSHSTSQGGPAISAFTRVFDAPWSHPPKGGGLWRVRTRLTHPTCHALVVPVAPSLRGKPAPHFVRPTSPQAAPAWCPQAACRDEGRGPGRPGDPRPTGELPTARPPHAPPADRG